MFLLHIRLVLLLVHMICISANEDWLRCIDKNHKMDTFDILTLSPLQVPVLDRICPLTRPWILVLLSGSSLSVYKYCKVLSIIMALKRTMATI